MDNNGVIRACPQCGQRNRTPASKLGETGRCGACKAALQPVSEPIDVDTNSFDGIVRNAQVPILVDFWADWCGPCRMAAPHVKKAAENMSGRAVVLKVDTEKNPDLAARFHVRGIPNFAVFKDGNLVSQQPGYVNHRQMEAWLADAGA